ncbi:type IV-A pilus assembly ATPase PilB [Alkalilimnicola sp. S0819]|uniref:type IV-A pilus assembly ATPase PilB n=1 Tax=Alkalilimnicola sp. S0819 TaxID=2613922 RepID=UPI0012625332|nr:type IV-A pilus assembly ATPase PilB [Alkalilimnicola sp. S0819]KAB7623135.1 type IV-A pilus assembly ATPase PilB [Alkalilimnicola sp. S0819]MPQ16979.1 type IV-A pilus assembly ATPase PilB [Alkalilimnicola sp. S0819]
MATVNPSIRLSGLAARLVRDGLLDEETARRAAEEAKKARTPLVAHLVEKKLVAAKAIAEAGSQEFGVPVMDLDAMEPDVAAVKLVKEKLVRHHRALPLLKRGKRLFVAVSDPTNLDALDEIKFHTGLTTDPVLVEEDKLMRAMDKALEAADGGLGAMSGMDLDADLDNLDISGGDEDEGGQAVTEADADDAPVVRFVNKVLLDAIKKGASDIHFEPYEKRFRVRFRQDGMLSEVAGPPIALANRISARIKVMSQMDIAERRVPQDGRIKMRLSKTRAIDFRVNTCPTLFGEKIVLRILDPSSAKLGIDALGYEPEQKERFVDAIHKPYGMVLVTGPTGSGKTVSLYTALNILNTADRNISTVEDPVEINLEGINQVNLNMKAGLSFASALRAFLRQDPDVIMVGEIRDLETAEIAIKAAQTGHMVLSTLHTNDAPQTLTRLANMGVPAFNIASSVSLIIAQRLARRLCNSCKAPVEVPRDALLKEGFLEEDLDGLTLYDAVGCDQCAEGYKGRVGIYQVMPVSEAMGRIIMEGGNSLQLGDQARKEGIDDLRRSGLKKVMQGVTSLTEVNRVTVE